MHLSTRRVHDMNGYSLERFVNSVKELSPFLCRLCLKVLNRPTQCKHCASFFCFDCIKEKYAMQILTACSKMCPNKCSKGVVEPDLFILNKYMRNKIKSKLLMRCRYAPVGCEALVSPTDIEKHENECEFQAYLCTNKGCY